MSRIIKINKKTQKVHKKNNFKKELHRQGTTIRGWEIINSRKFLNVLKY